MLRRRGGKLTETQGTATSAILTFRGPVIRGPQGNLLPSQRQAIPYCTFRYNEGSYLSDRPPWVWGQHIPPLKYCSSPHGKWPGKLLALRGAQSSAAGPG